jgi:hypothetical protein
MGYIVDWEVSRRSVFRPKKAHMKVTSSPSADRDIMHPGRLSGEKGKVIDMETRTITIRVSPEAARAYETAPAEQRRKLDVLLSLKLTEVGRSRKRLETIMSEISRKAEERGLTETILESILNER